MTTTRTARRKRTARPRTFKAAQNLVVAGMYLRISKDEAGDRRAVTRHKRECMVLLKASGWQVSEEHIYIDNDASATSGDPRPEFDRMLADVRAGRINALVAWHVDRIYRTTTDLIALCKAVIDGEHANPEGLRVRTLHGPDLDLSTVVGRMVAKILAAVSEQEIELKNERWWSAVMDNRNNGDFPHSGPRMYGWTREGKVIPEERKWVREVAKRLLRGETQNSVLRDINARGARATTGNAWRASSMRNLLLNPRIAGYATFDKAILYDKEGKPVRGNWKPLLDPEVWERLNAMLLTRTGPTPVRRSLLGGLMYCACGVKMITGSRGQGGVYVRTYRCNDFEGYGGCGRLSAVAEPVEYSIQGLAKKALFDPQVRAALGEQEVEEDSGLAEQLEALRRRKAQVEAAMDDPNAEDPSALNASVQRLAKQIKRVQAEMAAAPRQRISNLPDTEREFDAMGLADRRAVIDRLIAKVSLGPALKLGLPTFDPNRLTVTWQPQVAKAAKKAVR